MWRVRESCCTQQLRPREFTGVLHKRNTRSRSKRLETSVDTECGGPVCVGTDVVRGA